MCPRPLLALVAIPTILAGCTESGSVLQDEGFAVPASVTYPRDRVLSPLTPEVVDHLREIWRRGDAVPTELSTAWGPPRDNVFVKVGDSITAYDNFMACFTGDDVLVMPESFHRVSLDEQEILDTVAFFAGGEIAAAEVDDRGELQLSARVDPFQRRSHAACGGSYSSRPLDVEASRCTHPQGEVPVAELAGLAPLERELIQARPRFALLMFGTNDVGSNAPTWYGGHMLRNVRRLVDEGVTPILYTIPPRLDVPAGRVDVHNEIIRALAQRYRLPLIDFHLALEGLGGLGLSSDGIHPSYGGHPCSFSGGDTMHGQHMRNLLSIEMLALLRAALIEDDLDESGEVEPVEGGGSGDDPYRIKHIPFAMLRTGAPASSSVDEIRGPFCPPTDSANADDVFELVAERPRYSIHVRAADWVATALENRRTIFVEECVDASCEEWRCRWVGEGSRTIFPQVGRRYRVIIDAVDGAAGDYFVHVR